MPEPDFAEAKAIITSSSNPHLKLMRSLARRKTRHAERAFLIEGRRLVEDAVSADVPIRALLLREDVCRGWARELRVASQLTRIVEASVFNASSELEHSQGVAAICHLPTAPDPDAFSGNALVIADQVRDPGNLGTILRSTAASGVSTVLITPGSVDPYSPKVLRSGMGAHFRLNIGQLDDAWLAWTQASGRTVVVADMHGERRYDDHDWTQPFALVIGGETEAISPAISNVEKVSVRIPMARNVESLNAGAAASVLLFEAARQRGAHDDVG